MKKQILTVSALLCGLLTFAGCLRFENSLDLIYSDPGSAAPSGTTVQTTDVPVYTPVTQESTTAADPAAETTLPAPESTTADAVPTAENTTAAPVTENRSFSVPANNEYDILRTGEFTLKATMKSGNEENPMNMSVSSGGDLYLLADISGMEMGILIKNGKMYMLYPPEKKYLELNSLVMGLLKLDPSEFTEMAKDMGFEQMHPLTSADAVEETTFGGVSCTRYHLPYQDGSFANIYISGARLLAIENLTKTNAVESTLLVDSVTPGFPSMPPADYTKSSYTEFFKILYNNMG